VWNRGRDVKGNRIFRKEEEGWIPEGDCLLLFIYRKRVKQFAILNIMLENATV
jgi:hypothetical protein